MALMRHHSNWFLMSIELCRVCVFCGSAAGARPVYAEAARALARCLVSLGAGLVYGGASVGLMGILADEVLRSGGEVTGVIPKFLSDKEIAHRGLTKLYVVDSMHERKALMASLSDGFIAMPGGFGTLDEFCEILTWSQLGLLPKPCGLLNTANYYNPLLAMFDQAQEEGFVRPQHRDKVLQDSDPLSLLAKMREFSGQAGTSASLAAFRSR